MPAALDVPWDVIRLEFSQGMSQPKLAEKYGIAEGTIAARSAREKWVDMRPETHVPSVQELCKTAAQQTAKSLHERGIAYAERVFTKTSGALDSANLPPPKSWKDAEIVDRMARRAAGLDVAENTNNVLVSLWGSGMGPEQPAEVHDFDSQVIEVESEE